METKCFHSSPAKSLSDQFSDKSKLLISGKDLQAKCAELESQLQSLRIERLYKEEEIDEKNRKINYLINVNNDLEEEVKALKIFKERFDELLEERVVEQLNSIALKESTRLKI